MADIVERLRDYARDDHERGCQGRYYTCSCGYDEQRDPLLVEAADEIEQLRAALALDRPRARWAEVVSGNQKLMAEIERLRAVLMNAAKVAVDEERELARKRDCHEIASANWTHFNFGVYVAGRIGRLIKELGP